MFFKAKVSAKVSAGPVDFIVVGLGNPGPKYDNTRHNVGFAAIDLLANSWGCKVSSIKHKSLCGRCTVAGQGVLLLKPSTFMNLSGQAVVDAMSFYKVPIENVLVIYDDVSLDVGRLRIRTKGSDGGHNGIKSILQLTGSDQFPRIKIGVGAKPHPDYDLADWVLSRFKKDETEKLAASFDKLPDALARILKGDLEGAMAAYNTK